MKAPPILLAVTLLMAGPAYAQGTDAQRAACTPDVWRLCASHIPNVGAITACLRREKPNLSAGCRTVMESTGAPAQRLATPRPVAPRVAERVPVAPRPAYARRGESRVVVAERRVSPRMTPRRPVYAEAMPRRPVMAGPMSRRTVVHAVPRRYAVRHTPQRYAAGVGGFSGLPGLRGNRAAMREANYWMRQIGGMMGGMGGMGGMSLDSIRDMRVGDLLSMME
ncbi:hypothetical protein [Methylobacterium isbiliense]|jgi:hypothetical protein|uniref:Uncharacterized protein n=1 Tax=Methylobacterium isbiliense TaxID=315478 RepID=A0ABQ4SHR2_9HYPH|nr:hypothetical protein [Methylobacterium isbiliense]MDN3624161.1 hypothetical protein [Methylobacterium isbiliense]GJE01325.1 hypothetical protein GMJLKIPL_3255 [Methylobacterium isbiliense]